MPRTPRSGRRRDTTRRAVWCEKDTTTRSGRDADAADQPTRAAREPPRRAPPPPPTSRRVRGCDVIRGAAGMIKRLLELLSRKRRVKTESHKHLRNSPVARATHLCLPVYPIAATTMLFRPQLPLSLQMW